MLRKIKLFILRLFLGTPKFDAGDPVNIYESDMVWTVVDTQMHMIFREDFVPCYLLKSGKDYIVVPETSLKRAVSTGLEII
jgi:hypothetical protein